MDWSFAANLVWCASLPFIVISALDGWRAVRPGARVPMQWGRDGRPTWRAPRGVAFTVTPVLAGAAWLLLSLLPEKHDAWMFSVNLFVAAVMVAVSIWFVRRAIRDAA